MEPVGLNPFPPEALAMTSVQTAALLVRPEGFEPATTLFLVTDRAHNQLFLLTNRRECSLLFASQCTTVLD